MGCGVKGVGSRRIEETIAQNSGRSRWPLPTNNTSPSNRAGSSVWVCKPRQEGNEYKGKSRESDKEVAAVVPGVDEVSFLCWTTEA